MNRNCHPSRAIKLRISGTLTAPQPFEIIGKELFQRFTCNRRRVIVMTSCFPKEQECVRDMVHNDFIAYRQWYGLVPPEHERTINLGDLGRFNRDGEFIRLGKMFESSEKTFLKDGYTTEKWIGIPMQSSTLDTQKIESKKPRHTGLFMWARSSMPTPRSISSHSTIMSGR